MSPGAAATTLAGVPLLSLGDLPLEAGVPRLIASFAPGEAASLPAALAAGLDAAELRLDLGGGLDAARAALEADALAAAPTLVTVRRAAEGGRWAGPESLRAAIYRAVVPRVAGADVELSSTEIRGEVLAACREAGRLSVLSFHDFTRTPPLGRLLEIADEARALGADVTKVAAQVESPADLATLSRLLLERREQPLVVIGMGPVGLLSRVFFPALGSRLTFAAAARATAPGQLPLAVMVEELRRYYPSFGGPRG